MENLKIRYGKNLSGENAVETEYSDELPLEMKTRIKSAKDDDDQEKPPQ
jgi:hypothetical protein